MSVTPKDTKSWKGLVAREQDVGVERSCCSSSVWQKVIQHPAKHRKTWKDYALPAEGTQDKLHAYQAGGQRFTFIYSRGNWRMSGKQRSELSSDALQIAGPLRISIEEG